MTTTLFNNIFEGYAYSYPHKHSYRKLDPLSIQTLWEQEKKDALFLYIHLPFCEMRCGFCNLFTIAHPQETMVDAYLETLAREATVLKELILPERFAQLAIGGGTPTFLNLAQLDKLFSIVRSMGCHPENIPVSFEMSPKTITREKLDFLLAQGVDRVSMGIQSFLETEVKALGRPQKNKEVYEALDLLQEHPFETLNLDLIYGTPGQTLSSWLHSVQEAIRLGANEVYIYPLYIRPLTGINKISPIIEDNRFSFYREAKQMLSEAGFNQVSMRMFQKRNDSIKQIPRSYSCQEDGMIGMGAGARSYTRTTHYSSEYAVARHNIKSIIDKYISRRDLDFNHVDYGIILNKEERQRRFIIKSILHDCGLDIDRYGEIFDNDPLLEYPLLLQLMDQGMARLESGTLRLTDMGIDYSDAIGPDLYSGNIKQLINDFELQ